MNLRPEEYYVVGDSQYDIEAGKNACASIILVCRRLVKQKEMSKLNSDYIVSNLVEIRQILEGLHRGSSDQ